MRRRFAADLRRTHRQVRCATCKEDIANGSWLYDDGSARWHRSCAPPDEDVIEVREEDVLAAADADHADLLDDEAEHPGEADVEPDDDDLEESDGKLVTPPHAPN
jgi:hypothetical protein